MRSRIGLIAFGFTAGLLLLAGRAQATPTLDFGVIAPSVGTISYAGGAAPLIGSGIDINEIVGLDVNNNNNVVRDCFSCMLSFTTGNVSATTASTWTFGPGGSITITGGVDLNDDGDVTDPGDIPLGTTLLSGTFVADSIVVALGTTFKIAGGGSFLDDKDARLLQFYGLPVGIPYIGNFNISFNATGQPPNSFMGTQILSGDLTNSPTPEPGTVLLLGSGLAGFGYLVRRRRH